VDSVNCIAVTGNNIFVGTGSPLGAYGRECFFLPTSEIPGYKKSDMACSIQIFHVYLAINGNTIVTSSTVVNFSYPQNNGNNWSLLERLNYPSLSLVNGAARNYWNNRFFGNSPWNSWMSSDNGNTWFSKK